MFKVKSIESIKVIDCETNNIIMEFNPINPIIEFEPEIIVIPINNKEE